ncbi:DUF6000 family protein [Streptomyces sp. NPDC020917]|uniref:DUF6000 family protein n=1 Tax=Streptomyces sp. NPDC020917 TaxID=3365102 RepID=UPI00379D0936
MDLPRPQQIDTEDLRQRYVRAGTGTVRRYLKLLHGNFLRLDEADGSRKEFLRDLATAAQQITPDELTALLAESDWRPRLTAAWLIGLDRRMQFRSRIGELLLESRLCFSGQGYCFALARFGSEADAQLLTAYLDRYLKRSDLQYDQAWAIGALLSIDDREGSQHAAPFLMHGGLWDQWAHGQFDAAERGRFVNRLCTVADAYVIGDTGAEQAAAADTTR